MTCFHMAQLHDGNYATPCKLYADSDLMNRIFLLQVASLTQKNFFLFIIWINYVKRQYKLFPP